MTTLSRDIVLGYDGSSAADVALEWAASTAALEKRAVRVVMVENAEASLWQAHGWRPDHEHERHVTAVLARHFVDGGVELASGHVVAALLDASGDAALLVVGSRGHGPAGELFLGSVSQHVARHAPCPVVVVREPKRVDARQIVVGVDGSTASENALDFACRRAELTGETVMAVFGWRMPEALVDRRGNLGARTSGELEEAKRWLAEAVSGVRGKYPDLDLRQEAIPVPPGSALVDASSRATLVVTGSRGRGAFAALLLGSVSHHVLQYAHCPVAVVR